MILTTNPSFLDLAQAELQRAQPQAQLVQEFAPGVWRVALPQDFYVLAEMWRQRPPIFVRHICPILLEIPLVGEETAVSTLESALVELVDLVDPSQPFSVQTRTFGTTSLKPFDINEALAATMQQQTGAPLDVRQPQQILSVIIHDQTAYLGLSLALHTISDWAGGMHRFAREPEQISRAEFKLLEALTVFRMTLPPYGIALDLGAAPGGWTRILHKWQQYVTAVDPAALHPSLKQERTISQKRMTAEEYLAEGPDKFDLIVNDMRQDARDSARLMVQYAPYLYPHGTALMTFKLPENGRRAVIDHAFNILQTAYTIAGARQLFHNRSEITVYLQPVNRG
ncbi:MAG: SAM-dependent methyltransferase [Chloroflexota bacterium]